MLEGMDDSGPLLPFGWEWILLNLAFVVLLVIIAAVAAALVHRSRRRVEPRELSEGGRPAISPASIEAQLIELDGLLAQRRITEDEYAAMRSRILDLR